MVADIIRKKSRQLLSDGRPPVNSSASFHTGSAERTPGIADGSVDLIVTSPPFLDVVQYAADNWLRCWFVGLDAADIKISMHGKPEDWGAFIARSFKEFERVLASGGHIAFEVGDVRNGKVNLEELVVRAMAGTKFEPLGVMINDQMFTKTANCWGVSNNSKGTNTNRIVLARRA
jgi:DNA modification methylase